MYIILLLCHIQSGLSLLLIRSCHNNVFYYIHSLKLEVQHLSTPHQKSHLTEVTIYQTWDHSYCQSSSVPSSPLAEFGDVRSMPITSDKPSLDLGDAGSFTLETHGFTARRHPSALQSASFSRAPWNDEDLLKTIYIPEVEALMQKLNGCKTIITESALIRNCIHTEIDTSPHPEKKNIPSKIREPLPKDDRNNRCRCLPSTKSISRLLPHRSPSSSPQIPPETIRSRY